MNLLDGLQVVFNTKKGIILQTTICTKAHPYRLYAAVLYDDESIGIEDIKNLIFQKKDLNRIRKIAPILNKKLNRFELMDL